MMSFKNRTVAATAAAFATFVTVASAAPLRAEAPGRIVSYADLDLGSKAGDALLNRRIRHAADRVCGGTDGGDRMMWITCRNRAIGDARARIAARAGVALAAR